MTDVYVPGTEGLDEAPDLAEQSLLRVRLKLLWGAFKKNWALFAENPIGIIGLVIIGIFGLLAVMQPWLIRGFGPFRALVILIAWAGVTYVAFRSVQTAGGISGIIGVIIFFAASAYLVLTGATLTRMGIVFGLYGLVMWGFTAYTRTWERGLPRPVAVGFAVILGAFLAWGAVATMGAWEARTYDPVVGVELNPPTITRMVVNEVTDPDTEVSFREALLNDPLAQVGQESTVSLQPAPPDSRHLLGTDPLGRDVLSQLMFGARAAFVLGITTALVTVFFATTVGAVSAYYGGAIDSFFMRLADLLLMLPAIAIFIVMSTVFEFQLWHLAVFLGILTGFGGIAIILKSQALAVKVKPFIDAARVAGGSNFRIIFAHIVPNVMPLAFLYMMFSVTTAIQTEATLSFLGLLNIDMSWGIMINVAQSQGYLLQGGAFWWLLYPAGLSVTLMAAAFFLVGRGMDEVVNPRLRKR